MNVPPETTYSKLKLGKRPGESSGMTKAVVAAVGAMTVDDIIEGDGDGKERGAAAAAFIDDERSVQKRHIIIVIIAF